MGWASQSSESAKSSNVTTLSDADLKTAAAKGDQDAIQELARREAAKASNDDSTGKNVDTYA